MIPKRLVLDTNVCLDLFVFRDPRWASLHAALVERSIDAVTRSDCRKEWLLVLDYPHLPLDASSRAAAAARFDELIRCIDAGDANPDASPQEAKLPVCKDRDDQKFLELARDANAHALITKDKALLKLARRTAKAGLFLILPPEQWSKALDRSDTPDGHAPVQPHADLKTSAAKPLQ